MTTTAPRLTVGLPVYNGERYLPLALDALLDQSYADFELIISDNASTDGTAEIARDYQARDSRVRYVRQPVNVGATNNHNLVFELSRTELFKWASYDDLYGRDLLLRCVEALDADPRIVLAHAWQAIIDGDGQILLEVEYPLRTDDPRPSERFRSMLFAVGGDDFYGVIRSDVLRRTPLNGSYHHSDRTIVTELGLHGPFYQVPELLYYRRDHDDRAERAKPSIRQRSANMDPRRANKWKHPLPRLLAEYVWGYISAIHRAPISAAEKRKCYRHLALWMGTRTLPGHAKRIEDTVVRPSSPEVVP